MSELNFINLDTTDPCFNLAAEQYVFDALPRNRSYFMLWQNDNAVIIGKYQNAFSEVNEAFVAEHGIKVVRRLSGGGAVYHDLGNLNYTFVTDAAEDESINLRFFCEIVVKALEKLGLHAEVNGRNDITLEGRKISGNAQYLREGRVMHHGTLLFDSNLGIVQNVLHVDPEKIRSKGVKSVRSRVGNIIDSLPEVIDIAAFRTALLESVLEGNNAEEYCFSPADIAAIESIRDQRYGLWEWNYGRSPECTVVKSGRIEGVGRLEAYLTIDRAVVTGLEFRGDFFSGRNPEELAQRFLGKKASAEEYARILDEVDVSAYITGLTADELTGLLTS